MDQDHLLVRRCQVEMFHEHRGLIPGVLVQADFADAQDCGLIQELRDHRDHLSRQGPFSASLALMHSQHLCSIP